MTDQPTCDAPGCTNPVMEPESSEEVLRAYCSPICARNDGEGDEMES